MKTPYEEIIYLEFENSVLLLQELIEQTYKRAEEAEER